MVFLPIPHYWHLGGCDGNEPQRAYYSNLYKFMPKETMILTLGCGKFRIFDQDFGNVPGRRREGVGIFLHNGCASRLWLSLSPSN